MSDLIDTGEMYLRTIFELEEEGIPPLRARIAERLGQSGPTVSQTVARMERDELLVVLPDRSLELTDRGRHLATRVMRKHRLAECMLVNVVGLPLDEVHEEACRWEHVMSENVELRLLELLGHPTVSPFGNPIPGLAELGGSPADLERWQPLSGVASIEPRQHTVLRIAEQVQHQVQLLADLTAAGVAPGASITVSTTPTGLLIRGAAGQVELPMAAAELIMVAAD